jgi:hypothetical protein
MLVPALHIYWRTPGGLPWSTEIPWPAVLVELQSCFELGLAGISEAIVAGRKLVPIAAGDIVQDGSDSIAIIFLYRCTRSHHQCSQDGEAILSIPAIVFLCSKLLEERPPQTSIKECALFFDVLVQDLFILFSLIERPCLLRGLHVGLMDEARELRFGALCDFDSQVDVDVALEEACESVSVSTRRARGLNSCLR